MATRSATRTGARREATAAKETEIGLAGASLLFLTLSIIYFFPAFLPGRHIFGTDYLAGGYFFYDFVSQRLASGELPRWVPHIYGGLPLYSNPGSTFYPVRLFADFLLPVTRILPFIFLVQFTMAGVGMYLLARELGSRSWVALVSGLAFQFTGITLSSVFAGHDGRVIVATFAPLFFFFLHRGIRTGSIAPFAGAAATIGFSLLSFQIQSNYYLLIAGAIWSIFALVHLNVLRDTRALARRFAMGLAAIAFGFLLAAVNFLPFLDYVPESPRGAEGGRGYEYSIGFSMPPVELLAIAVPEHAGMLEHYEGANPFKLHTEYVGALVVVLLVLGFRFSRPSRYWWFFGGLALFFLSIAFGGHTPIYRLYYEVLPGTQRFRAPAISFFVAALGLAAMAAITLERMAVAKSSIGREPSAGGARAPQSGARDRQAAEGGEVAAPQSGARGRKAAEGGDEVGSRQSRAGRRKAEGIGDGRGIGRWLAAIVGGGILALVFAATTAGPSPRDVAMVAGFGRFAVFSGSVCGAIWLWWTDRLRTLSFVGLLSLVTVADLWLVGRNYFDTVPPPEVTFAPDDVVFFLQNQPQPSRVWVLPIPAGSVYRGHGNYLMLFDIEQAGGEHGNQLQRYNEFLGAGVDVYVDWSNFLESPNFLHAANIRYVISMVQLETPFLREVHHGSALIYENVEALPRVYLADEVIATADSTAALRLLADPDFDVRRTAVVYDDRFPELPRQPLEGSAEIVEATADRVVVQADANRAALLVLSDNYLPGWRASVNGVETPIHRTNHTFRGVVVGPGSHEVIFEFRPTDLYAGFYVYLVTLLVLAAYGGWLLWSHLRRGNDVSG